MEEDKKFIADKVRAMDIKKYNNLLTLGRWYTKGPKDANILDLFTVYQKIMEDSKKTS